MNDPPQQFALACLARGDGAAARRGRGVTLGGGLIGCASRQPRPLREIMRIRLWPWDDETGVCVCDIEFSGGGRLAVTSERESRKAPDCGPAYVAFLQALHQRLDAADRARIVFEDGYGFGMAQVLVLVGFTIPLSLLALRAGPQWLRLIGLALPVLVAAAVTWGMLRHGKPRRYAPERLPRRAMPLEPPR